VPMVPMLSAGPLETILQDIEKALHVGLHYLALAVALTLPGICAALETGTGSTRGQDEKLYKRWYQRNLGPRYPDLTDTDCYSLRCGVVHQGRFGTAKMQYGRVVFTLPGGPVGGLHRITINDALHLHLPTFCTDMIEVTRLWYANQSHTMVPFNERNVVRYRSNGLPPYTAGLPVIA
jgi:hypothetical protein